MFLVLVCATTVGFCYWASQEIYTYQVKFSSEQQVVVQFDVGVYLVSGAGCLAILATASNLMRQYPTDEEEQAELLMEDQNDEDTDSGWPSSLNTAQPPAYSSA